MQGEAVRVTCEAGAEAPVWTIENSSLSVRLCQAHLDLTVTDKAAGKVWRMEPETRGFLVEKNGMQLLKPLAQLGLTQWREAREGDFHGVELISVQPDPWQQYNVRVRVLVSRADQQILVTVAPHEDPGYNAETWIRELYYPRSFVHAASPSAHTVIPFQQGTLLPGNWPGAIQDDFARRLLRMWSWEGATGPWWGHVDETGAAYLAIMDTPDDAQYDFDHPAGGPTRIAPYWLSSFQAFRYPRRTIYRFYPSADHAALALAYRDYSRRVGRWRSIEEKRLEKPQMDRLRGAMADGIERMAHIVSLSGEQIRRESRTFHDIAGALTQWAVENEPENLYFVLRGWQTLGYDHAHPAAAPPCPEAGGWDGLREISDVAREFGILFGVHEQYRDFFYSSPFWSEDLTRKDCRRDSPRHSYWAGGTQSVLCPALMLDFVKMNVQQLRDQKIALNATYQDVLTAIVLEECYDHRHPVTRTQCREARYSIIDYYRDLGWLISSESASDWAAPGLDIMRVHWARAGREPVGIPVPLFSLAFHDSAVLVSGTTPPLLCALAGMNRMKKADRVLRRLHAATAYMPLTAHRLLSDDGSQQESVFGDQVTVSADMRAGTYRVTGLPDEPEVTGTVEDNHM